MHSSQCSIHFRNVLANLVAAMRANIWSQAKRMSSFMGNIWFLNFSFQFLKQLKITRNQFRTIGRMWQHLDLFGCQILKCCLSVFIRFYFIHFSKLNSISIILFWENTGSASENYQVFEILNHSFYFSM